MTLVALKKLFLVVGNIVFVSLLNTETFKLKKDLAI